MRQDPYIVANPPKREPVYRTQEYKVELQTKITGIAKPVTSTVTYNLEIDYESHFFLWKKTNIKVDHQDIPEKINEFYLKTAIPLNNIKFRCTPQGKINKLYKHNKLLKIWEQTQKNIKQEFTGAPVTQVLEQLDKCYTNEEALIQQLSSDAVLQSFYRSFINDYLVYYGHSQTVFTNTGLLSTKNIPFAGKKTLGKQGDYLHLKSETMLDKAKANQQEITHYFKNKIKDFSIDNLEITIKDDALLDYKKVWIQKTKSIQTVTIGHYKKEIILTLQAI
ncbi:hypothetical protein A8C32_09850 [Flavivirga aquatica]|uniref:Uncharacterized protein n=1 Tax=Flavivirga aquatica TaxID=1849968 RepID=A0A1E5TEL2_9FLAO|nr:hypothetical protein [Flavivirga aquatica]OEK09805.1 hypothetical protein A8C32_09850 [Flavivirga aquatica]